MSLESDGTIRWRMRPHSAPQTVYDLRSTGKERARSSLGTRKA